ncbi:MAG: SusC/RagA family TonB-linked outer membrane protein [Cytophagaceae bacterium]|jgi:TonB-linked SusC/RagA family outer membrane protein|nr:SusC/RagA family TonB-linked outer membrane protein [Cytophagaceae bacterium]
MPKRRSSFFCALVVVAGMCFTGSIYAADNNPTAAKSAEEFQQQQKRTIRGTVTDAYGPVIGASVHIEGTLTGTVSDVNGNFTIEASEGQTLVISFMGFVTQRVAITNQTSVDVRMQEDTQALDEVVVTALGIRKEAKALGYAVANIDASELVKTGSPNFATALYGKASGVRIQAAPGGATSSVSISVRGLSSITGNTQPLIILDGVPIRNGNANNDGYWGNQRIDANGLTDINPEDIENISILKGASASALYGSEAANGVVMITSKSGKRGEGVSVDFSATLSADFVAYMPEMQTVFGPGTYTGGTNDFWKTGGFYMREVNGKMVKSITNGTTQFGPKYDGSEVYYWDGKMRKYSALSSNPWKDIFRTGFNQTYNVGISHGGEKSNTRFSYTFIDTRPNQYNSDLGKHNFSLSGNMDIVKNVSITYSANYMRESVKNRPYRISRITNNFTGMFGSFEDVGLMRDMTVTSLGYQNVFGDGKTLTPGESFAFTPGSYSMINEYYWHILGKQQLEENNRLIASVTPSWEIIKGLTLRGRISTDLTINKIENKESSERPIVLDPANITGFYQLNNKRYEIYYGDVLLSYSKKFVDMIDINANVGWSGRREKAHNAAVRTDGGLTVENWFNLNASKNPALTTGYEMQLLKTAYFGTLGVGYNNYLYLEGTVRQEKSSTLAPENNTFFYPSVNASFIFTEALGDSKPQWFDYGKVRASYGIVGNAPDVYYANEAYTQKAISGYTYNITTDNLGNDAIRPEKKYEWEFGLESKFFGDRLGFEASYYTNTIEDQILRTTVPYSATGVHDILLNIGELANSGVEFLAYGSPVRTRDFDLTLNANIAFNKNTVLKLADGIDELSHTNWDGAVELKSLVGEPMGDIYAYVPKTDANGNKIVGTNGLYVMDFTERKKVANAMPKAVGGFGLSTSWKNIFLDAAFDFRIGGAVLNQPYQYMMGRGNLVESLPYRDKANGGLEYYFEGNDFTKPTHAGTSGPNGEKIFDNGLILEGVKEDGTPNNIIVPADEYYVSTYNWGAMDAIDYSNSIFDNSYLKFRELSIGYRLPAGFTSKFGCQNLSLSVFARNICFLYKNLPAFDAEATEGTRWDTQTVIGGSTVTTRTFGFSLRANF